MIELTPEQVQAQAGQKAPLQLLNPVTGEVFVLIRKDVYDLTRSIVGGGPGASGTTRPTRDSPGRKHEPR